MASKNWKDLDLSADEVTRIGEALKDEQFRKLFIEYAEEISDPENRRRYEEEISEMERERGMDVQFIHPKPGYVLKTSIDGKDKAFINICENDKIGQPSSKADVSSDGRRGLHWQIPHSHSHPREDVVKNGEKCQVFDVVYHPDTIRMTENPRFKKMVEDIAIEGIESRFGVSVDKKNMKIMKNIKYKGIPVATVMRSKNENGPKQTEASEILKDMPYPYDNKTSAEKAKEMMDQVKKKQEKQSKNTKSSKNNEPDGPTEPKYTIIHRSNMDLQEYRNSPDARTSTRPKELEIQIELPLLSSAKQVDLDVFEQKIQLESNEPAKYKLDLKLPYPVDDENGSARFDKSKRRLILTLPVQPPEEVALPTFIKEIEKTSEDESVEQTDLVTSEESKLIEELPPLEEIEETNISQETCPEHESGVSSCPSENSKSYYPKPQIMYSFPDFTFSQDDETVSFVLNVRNVSPESVSKSFQSPNVCQIKFVTLGTGGFPMHYSFLVHFPDGKQIVPDHCSSDVSDLNVVLLLLKARDVRGSWTDFQAGTSMDDLQDYVFVTESSLQKELDQLEAETVGNHNIEQPVANIHVTEMNKKKLSIKVQKANRKGKKEDKDVNLNVQDSSKTEEEDVVEEEDLPSSAGIEIFHERNTPNLHGILKQRSMSESSDDLSSSQGSCSPISPRDDTSKKSVHFNDRIDKTTFKPGTAVTSMTKALKSKRRRNRKRDEKKNGRRRQNSGGSEGSTSGEELELCRTSVTEEEEEEEEVEFCNQVIGEIQKEEAVNEEKKVIKDVKENNKIDDCVKGTSLPNEKNEVQMKAKAIKDKISEERTNSNKADSDDDDDDIDECDKIKGGDLIVKSGDGDFRTTKNKCANEKSVKVGKSVKGKESEKAVAANGICTERESENDADMNESVERVREPIEGTKLVAAGDVLKNKNIVDLQDKDTSVLKIVQDDKQNGNDSGVECGLDGGDTQGEVQSTNTQGDGGPEDLNSMDHRTKCAFQFSNALMFDLDVD